MTFIPADMAQVAWLAADDIARRYGVNPLAGMEMAGKTLKARTEYERVSAKLDAIIEDREPWPLCLEPIDGSGLPCSLTKLHKGPHYMYRGR